NPGGLAPLGLDPAPPSCEATDMNGEAKLRTELTTTGIPSYKWLSFDGQVTATAAPGTLGQRSGRLGLSAHFSLGA
ncbi:MAG: hypothetical protein M3Y72_07195, partial [Acidobacteriota bacterium]|nr:hypothetical protein [Acidobacteriota bacterium]